MEILWLGWAFFGVVGFGAAAVFAGFVARGWRPPLPLALLGPALLVTIGSIAAMATGGWAEGSAGWGQAVLAAGALLAVTAALVGGAAIPGAGSPARTTAAPALLSAAFSILATVGSVGWLLTAGARLAGTRLRRSFDRFIRWWLLSHLYTQVIHHVANTASNCCHPSAHQHRLVILKP